MLPEGALRPFKILGGLHFARAFWGRCAGCRALPPRPKGGEWMQIGCILTPFRLTWATTHVFSVLQVCVDTYGLVRHPVILALNFVGAAYVSWSFASGFVGEIREVASEKGHFRVVLGSYLRTSVRFSRESASAWYH